MVYNTRSVESGIPYARIMAYLKEELALPELEAGLFQCRGCCVQVRELAPRRLGRVALPRTELLLSGGKSAREEFIKKFLLRFLSAGG